MKEPETTTDMSPAGPGRRLHQARMAQNIELITIAEQLHMTVTVVTALEQDNYTDLPTRVFVRGYIRNYARLVNEPVDIILAEFDQVWPPAERPMNIVPPPRLAADTHPTHRWRPVVTWVLLLLGTLLFLLWWQGYLNQVWQERTQVTEPVNPTLDGHTVPIPPPVSLQMMPDPPALPEPAPQSASASAALVLPEEIDNTPAPETVTAEPVVAEDSPLTVPPVVIVRFRQASWVDIRDSTGTYQLTGNIASGEQHQLGGESPYQLVIGNAIAAELSIDGQPYDMSPHIRGNVARFTLITP